MNSSVLLGRPPSQTGRIVSELRDRIIHGELTPGERLATRVEMVQHFGAASDTVQKALEELQRDGFVTVKGRQGTFVASRPPHLSNYALVFPNVPGEMNRFFAALNHEAPGVARKLGREVTPYYGMEDRHDHNGYRRLLADVKARRLGGIIFTSVPASLLETPVTEEPGLPRVAILNMELPIAFPRVCTDHNSFWDRCAEKLLTTGRRNVALILPPLEATEVRRIIARLEAHGLNVPRRWVHVVPGNCREAARYIAELLFEAGRNRPDALVISDDNLVDHALAGMVAVGAKIPDDVEVVAHCNFPHPVASVLPVHRLGYDVRDVLGACFARLDDSRAGTATSSVTQISARYEEEMSPPAQSESILAGDRLA